MSVASQSSALFPTQVDNPVQGFDNSVKITAHFIPTLSKSAPPVISPRIQNKSLLISLKNQNRMSIKTPKTARPRPPDNIKSRDIKANPRFTRPPTSSTRRYQVQMDQITIDCLDDKANIPNDVESLRIITSQLRAQLDYMTTKHTDYSEAIHYEDVYRTAADRLHKLENTSNDMENVKTMVSTHQQLQLVVGRYMEEWEAGFEEFKSTTEARLEEMKRLNEEEIAEFDENAPEDIDMKFMHRSPLVLALRTKEGKLAMVRQFVAAQKVKKQADKIEMKELEEAYAKTQEDFLNRRKRLIEKQDKKVDDFLNHAENIRKTMIINRNKAISGYLRRMGILDKQIDQQLAELNINEDEVADPEIDEERAECIIQAESIHPITTNAVAQSFVTAQRRTQRNTQRNTQKRTQNQERNEEEEQKEEPPAEEPAEGNEEPKEGEPQAEEPKPEEEQKEQDQEEKPKEKKKKKHSEKA